MIVDVNSGATVGGRISNPGVFVGSTGPAGGSVALGVGEASAVAVGPKVGKAGCVSVGAGVFVATRVQVGSGVGVAGEAPGRATIKRLMIILPAMTKLMIQSIFWLRVRFRRLRLLTGFNLQDKCSSIIPQRVRNASNKTCLTLTARLALNRATKSRKASRMQEVAG